MRFWIGLQFQAVSTGSIHFSRGDRGLNERVISCQNNDVVELWKYPSCGIRRIGLISAQIILEIDSTATEEEHYLVVVLSDRRNYEI